MYSTTEIPRYLNSSETTRDLPVFEKTTRWTDAEIARFLHIIVRPILVVLGTVGNGLTVYIMRWTSLKEISSCFYMVVLALADTSK